MVGVGQTLGANLSIFQYHQKESHKMTKPSDVVVSIATPFKPEAGSYTPQADVVHVKPSNVPVAKKKPSTPVRNPAFREHEGLRELQRTLNSNRRPTPRKNK